MDVADALLLYETAVSQNKEPSNGLFQAVSGCFDHSGIEHTVAKVCEDGWASFFQKNFFSPFLKAGKEEAGTTCDSS
jgi:hypothetical protein